MININYDIVNVISIDKNNTISYTYNITTNSYPMKKFYVWVLIILIAGFVLGMFVFRKFETPQPIARQPLRIGLNPWIGNGLYYIAKEKGFFEKENIEAQLENFDDSAIGRQLLETDKIDVLPFTPETVVVLADAGVKIKIIGMSDSSEGADGIIASKEIKNISDLKGKKVAFEVGSPSHLFLSYLLDKEGLTTNDLTVIGSPAPDAGTAFIAGKVDAAVTWEPWLSKASERTDGHLLVSSKILPIFPDMFVFREESVKNRAQDIRAMLRAFFAARKWTSTNQAEAVSIIAKNFKITDKEVKDQLPTFRWLSYEDNLAAFNASQPQDLIQKAGDLWLKLGLIKTKINADDLIDASLLKDIYQ